MTGHFEFDNVQHKFIIEDHQLRFAVSHDDFMFWKDKIISRDVSFEHELCGVDEDQHPIQIKTTFIKSSTTSGTVVKISLALDYVIVWANDKDCEIDGLSAICGPSRSSLPHQTVEPLLNSWVYDLEGQHRFFNFFRP